jgi:hypothetical protein
MNASRLQPCLRSGLNLLVCDQKQLYIKSWPFWMPSPARALEFQQSGSRTRHGRRPEVVLVKSGCVDRYIEE